jgi:hypothetical protein
MRSSAVGLLIAGTTSTAFNGERVEGGTDAFIANLDEAYTPRFSDVLGTVANDSPAALERVVGVPTRFYLAGASNGPIAGANNGRDLFGAIYQMPWTAPSAPLVDPPTIGRESISLSWRAPVSDGGLPIKGSVVQMRPLVSPTNPLYYDGAVYASLPPTQTSFSANVLNGQRYRVTVFAFNAIGGTTADLGELTPGPAFPRVSISGQTVTENRGAVATLNVVRSGDLSSPGSFTWSTEDGTAHSGADYVPASGSVSFGPGQSQATITVRLRDDRKPEPTEYFSIKVKTWSNVVVTTLRPTVSIVDNDM